MVSLIERLASEKLDALVITSLVNVRYLTGFTGSNGALLLSQGRSLLFTDPRYTEQAAAESSVPVRIVKRGPLVLAINLEIKKRRFARVGFERGRISYADYARLNDAKPMRTELVAVDGWIEQTRAIKTPDEIAKIRASVLLNSEALERARKRFKATMTERDLASEIDYQQRRLGAEKPSFDTIVASGSHAALPHAHPRAIRIENDRLLLIDMGAFLDGYASDMTRTFAVGQTSRHDRNVYAAVLEAQLAALAAVRAGVPVSKVDRAARGVLARHGLDRHFVHSTGHGLGLEIHEGPRIAKQEKTKLEAGMVITIEPGVYLPQKMGVRIEDTVLVTASGAEILTPTPKELTQIA